MLQPTHNTQLDTDGLQADVMRFMAIIAFCLIAILTLVKNLDPKKTTAAVPAAPEPTKVAAVATPGRVPGGVVPGAAPDVVPAKQVVVSQKVQKQIVPAAPPQATPIQQQIKPSVTDDRSTDAPDTAVPGTARDQSLQLRFSSDAAFLSLISTRRIQLYGFDSHGYTGITNNFTITTAQPAGELYELLSDSVPEKIVNLFSRQSAPVTYLVALSEDTQRQLKHLMLELQNNQVHPDQNPDQDRQQFTGALVIHRDGHVTHET